MSGVTEKDGVADKFGQYRRKQIAELRSWQIGDDMSRVSVSAPDREAGSPKAGDMIARNPKNHDDQWLVAAAYFADNFELAASPPASAAQQTISSAVAAERARVIEECAKVAEREEEFREGSQTFPCIAIAAAIRALGKGGAGNG